MRSLLILSSMAAVAVAGYIYMPKLVEGHYSTSAAADTARASESMNRSDFGANGSRAADLPPPAMTLVASRSAAESKSATDSTAYLSLAETDAATKSAPAEASASKAAPASAAAAAPAQAAEPARHAAPAEAAVSQKPAKASAKSIKAAKKMSKKKHKKGHNSADASDAQNDGAQEAAAEDAVVGPQVAESGIEAATGLHPATGDYTPAAAAPVNAAANPKTELKDRWVPELSGQKALLTMGKSRDDARCDEAYSHCERPDMPKDLSLAGVVVKTERLVQQPMDPIEGKVVRGHYVNHTPAVYVK